MPASVIVRVRVAGGLVMVLAATDPLGITGMSVSGRDFVLACCHRPTPRLDWVRGKSTASGHAKAMGRLSVTLTVILTRHVRSRLSEVWP